MKILCLLFAVLLLPTVSVGEPIPEEAIPSFGGCYFARIGAVPLWRMRDQDGIIREFEPHPTRRGVLTGYGGWTATVGAKDVVTVKTPPNIEPKLVYHFKAGHLAEAEINGKRCRFGYSEPLVYESSRIVPLWPEASADAREKFRERMSKKWNFGKRQSYGFASPNQAGAVFAMLSLICLALLLQSRGFCWRALFLLGAAASLTLLVTTASRGAMVALGAGLVPLLVIRYRKYLAISLMRAHIRGIVLTFAIAALCVCAVCLVSTRFRGAADNKASDSFRIELLCTAPRMFCDAPSGWGSRIDVGQAYTDWYQPRTDSRHMFGLVSDHLTEMVALGWWKGAAYVFVWIAGLFALWRIAWRGGSAVPAVAWTALGTAAAFNVVLFVRYVSWVAIATLPLLLFERSIRKGRFWIMPCAIGFAGALLATGGLLFWGWQIRPKAPPVRCTGDGIVVNGQKTADWLIVDREVLGMSTVHQEIRDFYEQLPLAPAIGCTESLDALPSSGIRRLVLAGERGNEFIARFRKGQIRKVPRQIVFLSPPFGCLEIPEELRRASRVGVVIGEFAARYYEDYAKPPKWVEIVGGAEVYIPGWMRFCAYEL